MDNLPFIKTKSFESVVLKSGNPKCPYYVKFDFSPDKKTFNRKYFKNELDAQAFADEKNTELNLPKELKFENTDRIVFSQIKDLCPLNRVTLSEAYNFLALKIGEIRPVKAIAIADALPAYLKTIKKVRGLAANTLRFYEQCISTFFEANYFKNISDVSSCNLSEAFSKVASPLHVKRALKPFFDWCVEMDYATSNPIASVKPQTKLKVREIPHVLTLEQTRLMFAVLPPIWKPAFALWAFAGLRPSEIIDASRPGIPISNIDFENKRIRIDVGKMRRHPRIIVNAPANLWPWLEPLQNLPRTDAVAPESYECYINLKNKLPFDLPQDTLRHSYGTNAYFHFGESVAKDVMGHGKNTDTLFTFYKGLGTPATAKQYFSITPQSVEKWAKNQPSETVSPIVKRIRSQKN